LFRQHHLQDNRLIRSSICWEELRRAVPQQHPHRQPLHQQPRHQLPHQL
jgi:hypothetical protein